MIPTKYPHFTIALTGGIGSGKSAALAFLRECGAQTADCDDMVHAIYRSDADLRDALRQRCSDAVLHADGSVNRAALGALAFADPALLEWLNAQIHPRVRRMMQAACLPGKVNVIAIPLAYESGSTASFTSVVSVYCPLELRLQRLAGRGLPRDEAQRRMQAQWPEERKLALADFALVNDGSRSWLELQCRRLWQQLTAAATAFPHE